MYGFQFLCLYGWFSKIRPHSHSYMHVRMYILSMHVCTYVRTYNSLMYVCTDKYHSYGGQGVLIATVGSSPLGMEIDM